MRKFPFEDDGDDSHDPVQTPDQFNLLSPDEQSARRRKFLAKAQRVRQWMALGPHHALSYELQHSTDWIRGFQEKIINLASDSYLVKTTFESFKYERLPRLEVDIRARPISHDDRDCYRTPTRAGPRRLAPKFP